MHATPGRDTVAAMSELFAPGMTLHDRYRLDQRIGAGGMAEVWRGTDLVLGRSVAIKILDGVLAMDPELRAAARREAQAAARLAHPHITAVHDYAELAMPGGRIVPYLVQELLSGQTLAERLRYGPLPWPRAATIAGQIAAALAAAHQRGVVHQDIKPANVMLTPEGVKVLDFGVAAVHAGQDSPKWIAGTSAYAAPERLRQAKPEPSADVFSLGVLTYEMVTGRVPWPITTWEQAAQSDRQAPPGDIPPTILAALSTAPGERPSAAELAASLGPVTAPTLVTRADAFIPGAARVPEHATHVYVDQPVPPPRERPAVNPVLVVLIVVIAIAAVLLAVALMQSNGGNTPQAAPSTSATLPATAAPTQTANRPDAVPGLLASIRSAVNEGESAGQIESGRADEFRDKIDELLKLWNEGKAEDVEEKAQDLQERIAKRREDGEVTQAAAQNLISMLDQLIARVRS